VKASIGPDRCSRRTGVSGLRDRVDSRRTGRDGELLLDIERRGERSIVASSRHTLPLQVMAPLGLDDHAAVVSVLNPTGGLCGGDRLAIDVHAHPGAWACVTTPSATRVYRASGEPSVQVVRLVLDEGATVEWVPDHTIPFAGSAFRQSIEAAIGEGARLVLLDAFAAGRVARPETWAFAKLESAIEVRDARGWIVRDRFVLGPTPGALRWDGLGLAESFPYFATMIVVADVGVGDWVRAAEAVAASAVEVRLAAAALPRRGALARCLAPSAHALADACERLWGAARAHVLGAPPLGLRKS
jgi:urease accessory protein